MITKSAVKLVLDTNIVLDWLVFADPLVNPLAAAVRHEQVVLYTHAPALDELKRVLGYASRKLDTHRQAILLDEYRRNTQWLVPPTGFNPHNLLLPAAFPRCQDPDDQHFLALTLHAQADALVTRDKAVLALRRRAKKFGVTIIDVQQMATMLASPHRPL